VKDSRWRRENAVSFLREASLPYFYFKPVWMKIALIKCLLATYLVT
jgi:hypothetical protein